MPNRAKNILQAILTGFLIVIFLVIASAVDSLPIWVLFIAGVISWTVLLILMIHDATRKPTLYYMVDGIWYPVEPMTKEDIIAEEEKRDERLF